MIIQTLESSGLLPLVPYFPNSLIMRSTLKLLTFFTRMTYNLASNRSILHPMPFLCLTVDYFANHGSNVFVSYLDCSKAFDKICHEGLFIKLIEQNVPLCFLNILIYWLSNLNSRCHWQSTCTNRYLITSGVKQGGILTPNLFTLYMNDLLVILRKNGIGCHVDSLFVGAIMFADDLALIASPHQRRDAKDDRFM